MKKGQEWSNAQLEYLKEHYPFERAEDVGNAIGKSKSSVQHKACRMGIVKTSESFFAVRSALRAGANTWNFNGYKRRTSKGYIAHYKPEHPFAGKDGLVMEHRLVVEEAIGHYLPSELDVHHINGIKTDNRIENLQVLTHGEHTTLHFKGRKHE